MNIHPILVHFPIALLTVYGFLELIRVRRVRELPYWFYVKASLVITGIVSGFAAYQSGEAIEGQFRKLMGPTIEAHSSWAAASLSIFGLLAFGYLTAWVLRSNADEFRFRRELGILSGFITETYLAPILAVLGLVAITVTGALGGAMAYGPDIDPVVRFVVNLLGL